MAPETRTLLATVLALPESERDLLVNELLDSLPPGLDEPDDEQLEAELDRRVEEFRRDRSVAVPWSEIRRPR
jgi:putative addiction module component (TIGR02574 family)